MSAGDLMQLQNSRSLVGLYKQSFAINSSQALRKAELVHQFASILVLGKAPPSLEQKVQHLFGMPRRLQQSPDHMHAEVVASQTDDRAWLCNQLSSEALATHCRTSSQ